MSESKDKLKRYFRDFYAGKIRRPCGEDCPKDCDGKHNYKLSEYTNLFDNP